MTLVTALVAGRTKLSPGWLSVGGGLLFVAAGMIWALTVTKDGSPIGFIAGFVLTGAAAASQTCLSPRFDGSSYLSYEPC